MHYKNDCRLTALATVLVTTTSIVSSDARAQKLEEVVVTAQKRSEDLQDVPISVSAHTGDSLEKLGLYSIDSLQEVTPGVAFVTGAGGASQMYIRGIGTNTSGANNENAVATYSDGVYHSSPINNAGAEFFDVERIEVLKGPQGTLFGRNATGGAVLITTKRPSADTHGRIEASYGNNSAGGVNGYLSGALSEKAGIYGSLAAAHSQSDGYVESLNPALDDEEVAGNQYDSARVQLVWDANDDLSFRMIGDWTDFRDDAPAAQQIQEDIYTLAELLGGTVTREPNTYIGNLDPETSGDAWGVSLTADWTTDLLDIKYIGSYRDFYSKQRADIDQSDLNLFNFAVDGETVANQQEVQFYSNNEGPLQWIGGVFWYKDEYDTSSGQHFCTTPGSNPAQLAAEMAMPCPLTMPNPATTLVGSTGRDLETIAVFGEISYDISERTSITLGTRYTEDELTLNSAEQFVLLPNDFSDPTGFTKVQVFDRPGEVDESQDSMSYSVVLTHHFSFSTMAYASFKTGFKSGVFDTGVFDDTTPTEPEEVDAYEIGLKSEWLDGTLRLNAAAYYYEYNNLQVNTALDLSEGGNIGVSTQNAAEAEIAGADLELLWLVTSNLKLSFGGNVQNAEYTDFPDGVGYTTTGPGGITEEVVADLSNTSLPRSPDYSFNIGADYYLPLGGDNGTLDFNVNWYHSDDVPVFEVPGIEIDAYSLVNASATWTSSHEDFYVRLWGRNLTDSDDTQLGITSLQGFGILGTYRADMTYGLTAGYKF